MRTRGTSGTTVPSSTAMPGYLYAQRDGGCKGDGVTDDTAAINALIARVAVDRGDVLVFEPGCYLVPDGITETKQGMVVVGLGHVGFGPGSDWQDGGVQIKATSTGAWCWTKDSRWGTDNDYKGGRFENLCFVGDADTAGGLRVKSNHNLVLNCSAVNHTAAGGIGFLAVVPDTSSGVSQAGLNKFVCCTAQDCRYGFQAGVAGGSGAQYTHWIDCIGVKFTVGGIIHTGSGIRNYDDGSFIIGGHFESNAIGIECLQTLGIRISMPQLEDNTSYGISLNRASGTSSTSNMVVCGSTSILVGAYQVGDVIIGGEWQQITDNGTETIIVGPATFKIPVYAAAGAPTGGYSGEVRIKDGKLYVKDGSTWKYATLST